MRYRVKVPATSANVGAGFDSMGIALNLYNIFEVEEISDGIVFEGFEEQFSNKKNIFYLSIIRILNMFNYKIKGLKLKLIEQNIPVTRGLGSSSSCIVAGLIIGNKIIGGKLSLEDLINIATQIEGHPDNVVPALVGGFTVSVVVENGNVYYNKIDLENDLIFLSVIPKFKVLTEEARRVLPSNYSLKEGIYNISRAGFISSVFSTKNYKLLKETFGDCFHEPYRSKLIKNYDAIKEIINKNNFLCSFISGSGPTIVGINFFDEFTKECRKSIKDEINLLDNSWSLLELRADNIGAVIEER